MPKGQSCASFQVGDPQIAGAIGRECRKEPKGGSLTGNHWLHGLQWSFHFSFPAENRQVLPGSW